MFKLHQSYPVAIYRIVVQYEEMVTFIGVHILGLLYGI